MGEYAKAGEEFSEALAIFQRTSFPRGEGYVLAGLGHLSLNTGDDDKAEAYFRQAEAAWHSASDRQGEIFALNPLGEIAAGNFLTDFLRGKTKIVSAVRRNRFAIQRPARRHAGIQRQSAWRAEIFH